MTSHYHAFRAFRSRAHYKVFAAARRECGRVISRRQVIRMWRDYKRRAAIEDAAYEEFN